MRKCLFLGWLSVFALAACGDGRLPIATYTPDTPPVVGPVCEDAQGPVVSILAPPPGNLTTNELITETRPVAVCEVLQGVDTVDVASIEVEVVDAADTVFTPTVNSVGGDQYETAPVDLADSPNGPITIRCEGSDTNFPEPRCNSDEIVTYLDLGPIVTITEPAENPAVRGRSMTVRFSVEESLVETGDAGSALPPGFLPVVTFAGSNMPNVVHLGNMEYEVEIDFTDPAIFENEITDGARYQLIIEATNTRGVTRSEIRDVTVDLLGPEIKFNTPSNGSLAVGVTDVNVTVTDLLSEVEEDSVFFIVDVDEIARPMTRVLGEPDDYEGAFDVNVYPVTFTQVTINVVAADNVGNESTASITVTLDVVAPILSLDPPPVREWQDVMGLIECSESFDPLGDIFGPSAPNFMDTPNDGDVVGNAAEFRVRINERGNDLILPELNGVFLIVAGINESDVQLFVRKADGVPLVVNSDPSDTAQLCDAINPDINTDPAVKEVVIVDMDPFAPKGRSFFNDQGIDPLMPDPANDWNNPLTTRDDGYFTMYQSICSQGDDEDRPSDVCDDGTSVLTRVITSPTQPGTTTIFGVPKRVEAECVGAPVDMFANFEDYNGWLCAAVRVTDNRGNENVSAPIRVCLTHTSPNAPECQTSPPPLSACGIDTNPSDGVTPGTCVPETFEDYPGLQLIKAGGGE